MAKLTILYQLMGIDAIIIGAGACGLMCAVQAGFLGKTVLILEKSEKPGKKILISGGGRCNYTNLFASADQFITENPHFCKSAFSQWTVEDTIQFFETYGISGTEKTLGQLFPNNKNAKDVVEIFTTLCSEMGQRIICDVENVAVEEGSNGFSVIFEVDGKIKTLEVPKVVIATGGLPIPKMGATDFALRFAKNRALSIVPTAPALVPLTITGKAETWYAQLSGNSVFCRVSNERLSFEEFILFTHWGLSGPAILQISSYWRPGENIEIDFMPNNSIVELIEHARKTNGKILLKTLLNGYFSKKFTDAIGLYLPLDHTVAALSTKDISLIIETIHHFIVKPAGDKGYDKAEVMRGGISTTELSSKTLECKKIPGLYFGGECVDVTGWLGGYNFQWAWASGFVIAQSI